MEGAELREWLLQHGVGCSSSIAAKAAALVGNRLKAASVTADVPHNVLLMPGGNSWKAAPLLLWVDKLLVEQTGHACC